MTNLQTYRLATEDSVITPALVCYPEIIERNIAQMLRIAGSANRLWVHVKTYKCPNIVRMLMQSGVRHFKCATVAEAEMVAQCGAEHALLAYPLVGPNIERFVALQQAYPNTSFYAIGDSMEALTALSATALRCGCKVRLLMDVNTGLNRTGVAVDQLEAMYIEASQLSGLLVMGLHVYDGQRHETDVHSRRQHAQEDMAKVEAVCASLAQKGYACELVVAGGTPSFPCHAARQGVALSPGTCVLQDAGYASLYPDLPFEPSALVLTRVVSHPTKNTFTLDLGYKSVAADPPIPRAVLLGYERATTVLQNEEHWTLSLPAETPLPAIGQVLYAIPWHICPTTALYSHMLVAKGGQIVDRWPVTARDRILGI